MTPPTPAELAAARDLGLFLLVAGLFLVPVIDTLLRFAAPGGDGGAYRAPWRPRDVFLAVFVWAFVQLEAGVGVSLLGGGFLPSLVASELCLLSVAVVAAWRARMPGAGGLGALGLTREGSGRGAAGAVAAAVLFLPVLVGVSLLWPWLAGQLGFEVGPQAVAVQMQELSGASLAIGAVIAVGVAPLIEEVVFRGFLQPTLVRHLRAPGGIVATSILFALLHGRAVFLPIFALALLLGWIHWRTRRTLACAAVHALNNAVNLFLILYPPAHPS